jgi:hypothetical protein
MMRTHVSSMTWNGEASMKKRAEAGPMESPQMGKGKGVKESGDDTSKGRSGKHGDKEDPVSRRKGTGRHGEWIRRGTTDSPGAVDPQDQTVPDE